MVCRRVGTPTRIPDHFSIFFLIFSKKLDKPLKWRYASAGFKKPAEAYLHWVFISHPDFVYLDNTVSSLYAP